MLIKDKDILVEETPTVKTDKELDRERLKASIAHSHEAWGDAFDYYLRGITSKYMDFRTRASRLEIWGFFTVAVLLSVVLYIVGLMVDIPLLPYYYTLATLIPSVAVIIRRFHDTNHKALPFLLVSAVLSITAFFWQYALIAALLWAAFIIHILSLPSDIEDKGYGEAVVEDEIYDVDMPKILNKFRTVAVIGIVLWLGYTYLQLQDWSTQVEQKATIENIMETIEQKGTEAKFTPEEIEQAKQLMRATLRTLNGQIVTDEEINMHIDNAIAGVTSAKNDKEMLSL
jgi:uncharacterized membrane protein YhaH (DUF805 family)